MLFEVTNYQIATQKAPSSLPYSTINKAGQLLQLKQIYELSTTYVPLSGHVAFEFIS